MRPIRTIGSLNDLMDIHRCLVAALIGLLLLLRSSVVATRIESPQVSMQNHTNRQIVSNNSNNIFIDSSTSVASELINPARNATSIVRLDPRQQVLANPSNAIDSNTQHRRRETAPSQTDSPKTSGNNTINTNRAAINTSLPATRQHWRQMESSISQSLKSIGTQLGQVLDETWSSVARSSDAVSMACRLAMDELVEGLETPELWASQMLDASAKLPSGLLEGTLTELGNLDQCLDVRYEGKRRPESGDADPGTNQLLGGQYCSLLIKPHLTVRPRLHTICQRSMSLSNNAINTNQTARWSPFKLLSQNSHHFYYAGLRLGICTPSKCSRSDLQLMLTNYLNKFELIGQVKSCQVSNLRGDNNGLKLDFVQQCIVSAFAVLVLLSLLGTLVDLCGSSGHSTPEMSATASKLTAYATMTNRAETMKDLEFGLNRQHQQVANEWRRVQGKTCQYQVYQPSLSDTIGSDGSHSLGTQQNPIAELAGFECGRSSKGGDGDLPAKPMSTPSIKPTNDIDDEEWIAQLERNQSESQLGEAGAQESTSRASRWLVLRTLITCFSIRRSLRMIGKHTTPSASGDERRLQDMGDIKVIHGLRTIAMFWVIFGHTVGLVSPDMMTPCQYQVYQPSLSDTIGSDGSHSLGTQQNPIAELAGFECGRSSKGGDGDLPAKPMSTPSIKPTNDIDDEEWIAQLERNQSESQLGEAGAQESTSRASRWLVLRTLITCFSIRRSLRMIGKHTTPSASGDERRLQDMGDIKVIHGLRTIAMFWVIFGHTVGLVSPDMMNNLFSLAQLSCSSRFLQALLNATLAVNTFFMISGLVTVLSFARKCRSCQTLISDGKKTGTKFEAGKTMKINRDPEITSLDSYSVVSSLGSSASSNKCISQRKLNPKNKRTGGCGGGDEGSIFPADFKPFLWLAMRYFRLTPSYAAVIGMAIVLPALGSGPFWQETVGQMGPACRRSWWLNLLYLNNFIDTDRLCLIHSWYLSNDWQFFSLTLILFALFYKSRKLTLLMIIICLALASSATTFAISVANNFPPTIVTTSPAVAERWLFIHSLYYKPWPHLGSYLVGMLTGYCIIVEHKFRRMSSRWRLTIWLLLSLIALTLLNSIYPWNMGLQVEPLLAGLHSATFRTLWATCCGWLVFALVTRPANPLARLLSWQGFQVTSRLTFCTYLVHPLIIFYHFGTMRERIDSSIYGQLHRFMATVTLSYLAALVLSLLVESPSIQVQHLLAGLSPQQSRVERVRQDKRRPPRANCSNSESSATDWSACSSYSDQAVDPLNPSRHLKATSPGQVKRSHMATGPSRAASSTGQCSKGCLGELADPIERKPTRRVAYADEQGTPTGENPIALDAEFQERLAQAISRGFRIRSKLASVNMKPLGPHLPPKTTAPDLPKRMPASGRSTVSSEPVGQLEAVSGGTRSRLSSICNQAGRRSELSTFRHQQSEPVLRDQGAKYSKQRLSSNDLSAQADYNNNNNRLLQQLPQAISVDGDKTSANLSSGRSSVFGCATNQVDLNELIMMKQQNLLSRSHFKESPY